MVWWEFPAAFTFCEDFVFPRRYWCGLCPLSSSSSPRLVLIIARQLERADALRQMVEHCFFFLIVKLIVNLLLSLFIRIRCFTICCNLFWLRNLVFFFMETCRHPCLLGFPGWEQGYCCCKRLSGFGLGETAEELVFPLEKPGIMDHTACHCQGS